MRNIFVILLAVPLVSCMGNSRLRPASDEETTAVTKAYIDCLMHAARELDDQSSDASAIGLAIEGHCASEWIATKEVIGRSMSLNARRMFYERVDARQLQTATEMVLTERSLRKKSD